MYCDSCGKPVPENATFCSNCGAHIEPVGGPSGRLQVPATAVPVPPGEPPSPAGPKDVTSVPRARAACSFPGCSGAVVRRCAGYKAGCRNWLCATHAAPGPSRRDRGDPLSSYLGPSPATQTDAGLCPDCTERKLIGDTAEMIYADYQKKAEWVVRSQNDWIKTAGLITVALDCLITYPLLYLHQTTLYLIFCLVGAVVWCGILVEYHQAKKESLARAAEHNPGFAEFYQAWRENKELRRGDLADAGGMGVIALGVAADAVKAQQQTQLGDDTHGIHEDQDKV